LQCITVIGKWRILNDASHLRLMLNGPVQCVIVRNRLWALWKSLNHSSLAVQTKEPTEELFRLFRCLSRICRFWRKLFGLVLGCTDEFFGSRYG
jgi:hypothetical protein